MPPVSKIKLDQLSLTILSIDHYQSIPHSSFDQLSTQFGGPNFKVPVLRVFGTLNTGQKACLHVHQVYPYFYIPYDGDVNHVHEFIQVLGKSINVAIGTLLKSKNKIQAVMAIILVRGIDFYGFHSKYSYFLKIYLLNPNLMTKIVQLLESGTIMATKFKVFDAHIPYTLQFLVDYNLYGMDTIDLSFFKFRLPFMGKKF